MSNAIATRPEGSQSGLLQPSSFADAIAFAELMCKASLVPQHLQGKPADCLLVIEQAQRWGLSPFAVAACTSVISGKLMFEGKLIAAVVNTKGDLEDDLDFQYEGHGNDLACTVIGKKRSWPSARTVTIHYKDAKTTNRMWQTQPEQQLAYHGARVWARRYMPQLMMGLYSPEEFSETQPSPKDQGGPQYSPPTQTSSPSVKSAEHGAESAAPSMAKTGVMRLAETVEVDDQVNEEYTETLPVYDAATGEEIGQRPAITSAQNAKIHALLNEIGHHLDSVKGKERIEKGKYRQKLKEKFCKEHTNELSTGEASWVIEWLLKCQAKLQRAMGDDLGSIVKATAIELGTAK